VIKGALAERRSWETPLRTNEPFAHHTPARPKMCPRGGDRHTVLPRLMRTAPARCFPFLIFYLLRRSFDILQPREGPPGEVQRSQAKPPEMQTRLFVPRVPPPPCSFFCTWRWLQGVSTFPLLSSQTTDFPPPLPAFPVRRTSRSPFLLFLFWTDARFARFVPFSALDAALTCNSQL